MDFSSNCWEILGISPTDDKKKIRQAYSVGSKKYHPEEYPEQFQALHQAYKTALTYLNTGRQLEFTLSKERLNDDVKKDEAIETQKGVSHRLDFQFLEKGSEQEEIFVEKAAEAVTEAVEMSESKSPLALKAFMQLVENPKKCQDESAWIALLESAHFGDSFQTNGFIEGLAAYIRQSERFPEIAVSLLFFLYGAFPAEDKESHKRIYRIAGKFLNQEQFSYQSLQTNNGFEELVGLMAKVVKAKTTKVHQELRAYLSSKIFQQVRWMPEFINKLVACLKTEEYQSVIIYIELYHAYDFIHYKNKNQVLYASLYEQLSFVNGQPTENMMVDLWEPFEDVSVEGAVDEQKEQDDEIEQAAQKLHLKRQEKCLKLINIFRKLKDDGTRLAWERVVHGSEMAALIETTEMVEALFKFIKEPPALDDFVANLFYSLYEPAPEELTISQKRAELLFIIKTFAGSGFEARRKAACEQAMEEISKLYQDEDYWLKQSSWYQLTEREWFQNAYRQPAFIRWLLQFLAEKDDLPLVMYMEFYRVYGFLEYYLQNHQLYQPLYDKLSFYGESSVKKLVQDMEADVITSELESEDGFSKSKQFVKKIFRGFRKKEK